MDFLTQTIMKVGQRFPLTIKRLGINGEGVGFFKRNVVFVKGAIPGEVVTAEVTKLSNNFAEAKIVQLREKSPARQTPPCVVYEECGGCQLQHMTYDKQLVEKRDIIVQAMERYASRLAETTEIRPTIGMDEPWHYRNKSQFQVRKEGKRVYAGLFASGTHKLLNINDCLVQHPVTSKITVATRKIIQKLNIPVYDGKSLDGIIRTIVVRTGIATGQTQVVLVTTRKDVPHLEELVTRMKRADDSIVSITQNINRDKTTLVFGEETITLFGKDTIHEELGEFGFDLASRAFFQLNPKQTVNLYNEIKKAAALTGEETVVDAYCGVGTVGLWLAKDAKEVRGMDVIPDSVQNARDNAKKHGLTHTKYVTGTAEDVLARWKKEGFTPDVITVDPPRTGLALSFINTVKSLKPQRFVYTSCNPSTLAKDLNELAKLYTVDYIQPVDMFPQTSQIEAVVSLSLR